MSSHGSTGAGGGSISGSIGGIGMAALEKRIEDFAALPPGSEPPRDLARVVSASLPMRICADDIARTRGIENPQTHARRSESIWATRAA